MNFLWTNGTSTSTNKSWFSQYGWITLCIISVILLVLLILSIITYVKVCKKEKASKEGNLAITNCFGEKDNIISCEAKGSRLILVLKDYSKVDELKLKELGITSIIKQTNKITLIAGSSSKELEELINKNK